MTQRAQQCEGCGEMTTRYQAIRIAVGPDDVIEDSFPLCSACAAKAAEIAAQVDAAARE